MEVYIQSKWGEETDRVLDFNTHIAKITDNGRESHTKQLALISIFHPLLQLLPLIAFDAPLHDKPFCLAAYRFN